MGYSRNLCAQGGRFSPPPAICQTTGPILDPKTALHSSGLELSEYVEKCYLFCDVDDDVTGQVKCTYFFPFFCPCWLRRTKQPYQIEIKPRNDMDRVWVTSKYPLSLCGLLPTDGFQRSKFRKKIKFKVLSLGGAIHVFGSDSRQECEK